MKNAILWSIFIGLLNISCVAAQQSDTVFLDNQWKATSKNQNPYYYRISQKLNDSIVEFKDFYIDGTLQNSDQYNNGVMFGRWKYYTRNGILKSEVEHDGTNSKPKIIKLDEYKLKPNRDSVYFKLNYPAMFGGDSIAIHDYINAHYKLPPKAIKNGVDSFNMLWMVIIDQNGKVSRVVRLKSSPGRFSKESKKHVASLNKDYKFNIQESFEQFLLNLPPWTPGLHLDRPVKYGQVLEVKYKYNQKR